MKNKHLLLTTLITFACLIGGGGVKLMAATEIDGIYYSLNGSGSSAYATVVYNTTTAPGTYSGNVVIPESVTFSDKTYPVTQIAYQAFMNSTGLTSITIPSSITFIYGSAFSGCTALASVTFNATACGDATSAVFNSSTVETFIVTIGDNVTKLPNNIFNGLTNLKSITIPSSVTSIGNYTFNGCTGLTSITIPNNVTSIGDYAFKGCSGITSITIPSNVTSIGTNAFENCTGLTSFTIGDGITSIGNYTFSGCTGLTSITIPNIVTSIGNYAFKGCSGIASITIPSSVTSIGTNAFENCTGLTEINYNVTTHNDFSNANKPFKGVSSYNSTTNIALNIGFNVEKIPAYVFNGAKVAGDVVIPSSVTSIGESSFFNGGGSYTSITNVYMLSATPPTLANSDIFKTGYNAYNCNIKVLYSSDESILNAYKEAEYWSTYSSNISETNNFTVTNMDLTGIATPFTIPSGNTLTVTGTATNPTAANLVIEDGTQFITSSTGVQATVQKSITAASNWGTETTYTPDNWYFIAAPLDVSGYSPGNVTNLLTGNYDFYKLNPANSKWENYKNQEHTSSFSFQNGISYLYANNNDITISFIGSVMAANSNVGVTLSSGWNLIGNPYTYNSYVNESYYKMNGTRTAIEAVNNAVIPPCTGVIIKTTDARNVTFTQTAQNQQPSSNLQMTLAQTVATRDGNTLETLDNAILSFNEGSQLEKFYFMQQNANLYIPQGTEEYAIVNAQAQGEMPVNFRANENGQYTLTVNAENVEMNYLHLIDNMTGADIDLLATPSYTFNAKTTDYESRFRLLFAANGIEENNSENASFAFFANGNLIVNNEGEATLQVFDMTGRQIDCRQVHSAFSIPDSAFAPGVYVIRLINGNNVKTQKVVVK